MMVMGDPCLAGTELSLSLAPPCSPLQSSPCPPPPFLAANSQTTPNFSTTPNSSTNSSNSEGDWLSSSPRESSCVSHNNWAPLLSSSSPLPCSKTGGVIRAHRMSSASSGANGHCSNSDFHSALVETRALRGAYYLHPQIQLQAPAGNLHPAVHASEELLSKMALLRALYNELESRKHYSSSGKTVHPSSIGTSVTMADVPPGAWSLTAAAAGAGGQSASPETAREDVPRFLEGPESRHSVSKPEQSRKRGRASQECSEEDDTARNCRGPAQASGAAPRNQRAPVSAPEGTQKNMSWSREQAALLCHAFGVQQRPSSTQRQMLAQALGVSEKHNSMRSQNSRAQAKVNSFTEEVSVLRMRCKQLVERNKQLETLLEGARKGCKRCLDAM